MSTLRIRRLSRTYPDGTRALHDVSLDVPNGMFGLLGPNGAGKSTLMRTVATLQRPDTGTVHYDDIDVGAEPERIRAVLGYLPQDFGFYPHLTARETLDHFATLKGAVDRSQRHEIVESLLAETNLDGAANRKVGTFSGGMRQRLGLAIALIGRPRLLVLDEPTAGLDPLERRRFHHLLAELASGDAVVVLSTHIVDDVEELCSTIAVLDRGRVVLRGTPQAARRTLTGRVWERAGAPTEGAMLPGRLLTERRLAGAPVLRVLADTAPGDDWQSVEPTLEDVYFAHTTRDDE